MGAVHQILPNFSYGDAIGHDTLHLRGLLRKLGYESDIFAGIIHPYLVDEARNYKRYRETASPDNLLIYHFSVGSEVSAFTRKLPDRLVIQFHNITPYHWFAGINPHLWELSVQGEDELRMLAGDATAAWGDSAFNCEIMHGLGYEHTEVLPIIADLDRFDTPPNKLVTAMHGGNGGPVFLFVGRITPNKRHEDIIRAFAYYQRFIDLRARLFLVGEYRCCSKYYHMLQDLIRRLRVSNITFTGMVDFDELVAYYRLADIFLCMSEHEGFCVPLLEAFHTGVPVVAYAAAAVPET
ncbi:glycosyltransferase family 4 protein, partial [bacterium]|nr:glycosyltransferase family 4 protein [candidate division CSSED10-310 bacterium]